MSRGIIIQCQIQIDRQSLALRKVSEWLERACVWPDSYLNIKKPQGDSF